MVHVVKESILLKFKVATGLSLVLCDDNDASDADGDVYKAANLRSQFTLENL